MDAKITKLWFDISDKDSPNWGVPVLAEVAFSEPASVGGERRTKSRWLLRCLTTDREEGESYVEITDLTARHQVNGDRSMLVDIPIKNAQAGDDKFSLVWDGIIMVPCLEHDD